MKKCLKCSNHKDVNAFTLRKDSGKYRNSCIECENAYFKARYEAKREQIREKARIKNQENPEPNRKRVRKWKAENPEKVAINRKRYYTNNKEKINRKAIKRNIVYRRNNPDKVKEWRKRDGLKLYTRITNTLRARLRAAIKGSYKSGSAVRDLGCSVEEFKLYLEKKFYPHPENKENMSWLNYGKQGWHIDHIIPLSAFDLTNDEEFLKACHYTNLQPLWAEENLRKSDKVNI